MLPGHGRRMQPPVMLRAGSLMAQQIPAGSRVKKPLIAFPLFLPQGQGDGTVGKFPVNRSHQRLHHLVRHGRILTALKDEGAETQTISFPAAFQDFLLIHPVADGMSIAFPDSAVIAVVPAYIGHLHQPPDVNLFSIDRFPHPPGPGKQLLPFTGGLFPGQSPDQFLIFLRCQPPFPSQPVQQLLKTAHPCSAFVCFSALEYTVLLVTPGSIPSFPDRVLITFWGASRITLITEIFFSR